MATQPQLLQIPLDSGDVVYTPDWVAKDMVDFFKPSGRILEPCAGDGVFLRYLPPDTEWCEIQEGRDFFAWHDPVDWIIGNPPYKIFAEWFEHSTKLANNICYVLMINKPFNGTGLFRHWFNWGKIIHMRYYGRAGSIGFPCELGFPIGAVHFQRGYRGPMYTTMYGEDV